MKPSQEVEHVLHKVRGSYMRDHWADEIEPELARVLDALSDPDWEQLSAAIAAEPLVARENLAKALRYTVTDRSTAMLIQFLRSDEPSLGRASTQSLFDRYQFWLPDVSIRAELERHIAAATPEVQVQLQALLAKALG